MCCNSTTWTPVADFGHAAGVDLDLGKCSECGSYLMAVSYGGCNYVKVREERALYLLSLQRDNPELLRKVLKRWVDG